MPDRLQLHLQRATMLEHLPGEMLISIIEKLSKRDLFQLSLASKYLHGSVQSELYRDFTLITMHERHYDLHESRFLQPSLTDDTSSLQPRGVYSWIRHLTIEAPLHNHANIATLWGMDINETSLERRRMAEYMEFLNLYRNVQGVLTRLPHNSLQSFSWHLGCCLPKGIFSAHGYLARRQRQITSLSIRVYPGYTYTDGLEGLTYLRNLHHLSWKQADFIDSYLLYDIIEANCRHLESLEVGFEGRYALAPRTLEYCLQSTGLFSTVPEDLYVQFDALHTISLGNVSFKLAYSVLSPTFDFSQIRKLKLQNCRCVSELLRALRYTSKGINLIALECDYEETTPPNQDESIFDPRNVGLGVPKFLESFRGLEQLYVRAMDFLVQSSERTPWAILKHSHTLKRLAYHYHDMLAMGQNRDCPFFWRHRLYQVLDNLRLEALGINIIPCDLRTRIAKTQTAQTLKLLHFRMTGPYHTPRNLLHKLKIAGLPKECVPRSLRRPKRCMPSEHAFAIHLALRMSLDQADRRIKRLLNMIELLNFVKWAFSPDGLPNLMVLAYGDFSCKQRHGWSQVVFVRYPRPNMPIPSAKEDQNGVFGPSLPFRIMHPEDEYLWDEIDGAKELLEACPQPCAEDITARPNENVTYPEPQESYFSDDELPGAESDDVDYFEEFAGDFFD